MYKWTIFIEWGWVCVGYRNMEYLCKKWGIEGMFGISSEDQKDCEDV